jgi:hypothetical protein
MMDLNLKGINKNLYKHYKDLLNKVEGTKLMRRNVELFNEAMMKEIERLERKEK